jgi:hypothetical protein
VLTVLVWQGRASLGLLRKSWLWTIAGLLVSFASFGIQRAWMIGAIPSVDPAVQARFIASWVDFFDYHRRPVDFGMVGVQICIVALVTGVCLIALLDKHDVVARRVVRIIVVASIFALLGAAVSHMSAFAVPQTLLMLMPTRVFLVANVMFFAALFGFVIRVNSSRMTALAFVFILAVLYGHARAPIVAAALGFVIWKKFLAESESRPPFRSLRWIPRLGVVGVLLLTVAAVFQQIRTSGWSVMTDRTNNRVLSLASTTNGLLAIGTECCAYTQLRTRRPLIVEPLALDQITYAPESGPDMNEVLKAVYGVDLLYPPEALRSANFDEDLTPVTRPLWEKRTAEEWTRLGATFGFTAVLANPKWVLDDRTALYRIP